MISEVTVISFILLTVIAKTPSIKAEPLSVDLILTEYEDLVSKSKASVFLSLSVSILKKLLSVSPSPLISS